MRTIAIGLLGIVLVQGGAAAQTIEEQTLVIRDFYRNIAAYSERDQCLDPTHAAAMPAPRIFTMPVAMVFRQIITKALDERGHATAMSGPGNWPLHRPMVLEPFPATELFEFPVVLADALPPLPAPFEYRLIGRDLVLRDREANLIIGVLRDAIGGISTMKR